MNVSDSDMDVLECIKYEKVNAKDNKNETSNKSKYFLKIILDTFKNTKNHLYATFIYESNSRSCSAYRRHFIFHKVRAVLCFLLILGRCCSQSKLIDFHAWMW